MHPETVDEPATLEHIQADICEMLRIFRRVEQVIDKYEPLAAADLRVRAASKLRKLGKGRADGT
jgi:hypothetical protein